MIEIRAATLPHEIDAARRLMTEYAASLDVDLGFQGFDAELARLPGEYSAPQGRLLVAWRDDEAVGCVAMRPLANGDCEMKRLYVRPSVRGERLGRRLAERVCDEARAAGHRRICLDTLPSMESAQALYRSLGFDPIAPYVFNPVPGTRYLARVL